MSKKRFNRKLKSIKKDTVRKVGESIENYQWRIQRKVKSVVKKRSASPAKQKKKVLEKRVTNYADYLQSEHWKKRRIEFLKINPLCIICRSEGHPHVHHVRYSFEGKSILFREQDRDLRRLCGSCHTKLHKV